MDSLELQVEEPVPVASPADDAPGNQYQYMESLELQAEEPVPVASAADGAPAEAGQEQAALPKKKKTNTQVLRNQSRLQKLLLLEFCADTTSQFREMTRPELLSYIRKQAHAESEAYAPERAEEKEDRSEDGASEHPRRERLPSFNNLGSTGVGVSYCQPRDLRKLDSGSGSSADPTIVARKHSILVNLPPFRAVILHTRCLILVPQGADAMLSLLMERLRAPQYEYETRPEEEPPSFEFKALEAVLGSISVHLADKQKLLEPKTDAILSTLRKAGHASAGNTLEHLRSLKNACGTLAVEVGRIDRAMTTVLDEDEDMAAMYLTHRLSAGLSVAERMELGVEEVETMFEAYLQDVHTVAARLEIIRQRIENTESLHQLKMDSSRNRLLAIEIVLSLVGLGIGFCSMVGGFFGMNVTNHVEDNDHLFVIVVAASTGFAAAMIVVSLAYFVRVRLISLSSTPAVQTAPVVAAVAEVDKKPTTALHRWRRRRSS